MKSWWQQGSPPCYVTASCSWILIMCFNRHDISSSTQAGGEKSSVTRLHTLTQTETCLKLSSSIIWHVHVWMSCPLGVCCYPHRWSCSLQPTCIVNHCQVCRSKDTWALISGSSLLYDTSRRVQSCPFLVVILAPYLQRVWCHHFWIWARAKHLVSVLLMTRYNDRAGTERCSTFQVWVLHLHFSSAINQLSQLFHGSEWNKLWSWFN